MALRRILIIEDEAMIAMMIEDYLALLGWEVVGVAGSLDQALAMAREVDIDAAILDVNLHGRDSFDAADILHGRHIPFVFASGYGSDGVCARFRDVPVLTKPFDRDDLERALHYAMAGTSIAPPAGSQDQLPR